MFKSIYDLAKQTALSLHITTVDERLRIIVQPHVNEKSEAEDNGLTEPLALEGLPDELDREFVRLLTSYTADRSSLVQQLEVTTAVLNAAKDKASQDANKGLAKANRGTVKSTKSNVESKAQTLPENDDTNETTNGGPNIDKATNQESNSELSLF